MSGLPAGWAAETLAGVVEADAPIIYGILQPGPDVPGGVPYVRPTEIKNNEIDLQRLRRTSASIAERYRRASLQTNDVVLSIVGTIGKVALVPPELSGGNITQSSCRLRADSALVEAPFLAAFLKAPQATDQFGDLSLGTAVPRLNLEDVRRISLPLPPVAEQRRIVAKLDALTARTVRARADLDRIPALAARYKQAVLAKAFSGELTAAWRAANGVVEATWPRSDVGSLTTDVRYGTATRCAFSPSETPVLRIPNIAKGRIDTTDLKHASFDEKERAKLALKAGDVLVIRSNGSLPLVGRAAVATDEVAGFIYAGYLIRLRLNMERVSPEFLQLAFEEPSIRALIEGFAKSTSGVNNINSEQLKSLMFPLPSLVEQSEIVRRVDASFAEIDRLTAEAAAARRLLDRLDQAILAKAFRGELVPQDPADESASVLLERIRAERAAAPKPSRGRRKAAAA